MARPSSKKVTRAAQTGGGRTTRGGQAWAYWALLAVVTIVGTVGIFYSRDQRRDEIASAASLVPPKANEDHWHAAYGIYICDKFLAPITDQRDPEGIHTHGDGVIHVHPFLRRSAGKNATLGKFFEAIRWDFDDDEIEVPGQKTYREGRDKCNGKDAVLQIKLKGQDKVRTEDLAGLTFSDRMVLTIAFVPKDAGIPAPLSEPNLDNLTDLPESSTTVPAAAQPTDSTTTTPGTPPATDTTSAPTTTTQ